jgi:DNA helicase II / ATP-dependent DNA helicase PcrA
VSMVAVRRKKPTLVIAGPGAGKTHDMVDRIVKALPSLHPCRYLAAITFTNMAANNIRKRVYRITRPGPNVFIGTIHSFVNQFLITPFARPFNYLPNERIFAAIEIDGRGAGTINKPLSPVARSARRSAIIRKLLSKGIEPYEEMLRLSRDLIENKTALDRVSYRLQFLFIDEFQDVDTQQLEIFHGLRKANRTHICAVGDPEQFIYSFTYGKRGVKAPLFEKIPFFRFGETANTESLDFNHRACHEIVDFTNRFREEPKQRSSVGVRGEPRVLFLARTALMDIIQHFQKLQERIPHQRGEIKRLYLGYENARFDEIREKFGIRHFSNASRQHKTLLDDALELLALCCGSSQRKSCDQLQITVHQWRKWGVAVLRDLRDNPLATSEEFLNCWLPRVGMSGGLHEREEAVVAAFGQLKQAVGAGRRNFSQDWSSSIHRAKGVEANAVLVVASTLNELNKWCVTDRLQRGADKRDTCRVGFVAFTRAMELLCIACLQPLDSKTRANLESIGVAILTTV